MGERAEDCGYNVRLKNLDPQKVVDVLGSGFKSTPISGGFFLDDGPCRIQIQRRFSIGRISAGSEADFFQMPKVRRVDIALGKVIISNGVEACMIWEEDGRIVIQVFRANDPDFYPEEKVLKIR